MAKKLNKRQRDNEALKNNLEHAIEQWLCESLVEARREHIGFIGERTAELMANAAFAVLEGIGDVQDYLQEQGFHQDD
jgi:hypothetical protein